MANSLTNPLSRSLDGTFSIHTRRPFPTMSVVFGSLAIVCLVIYVLAAAGGLMLPQCLVLGLGPAISAILCWPWGHHERELRITDDGLVIGDNGQLLPWDHLRRFTYGRHCINPQGVPVAVGRTVNAYFLNKQFSFRTPQDVSSLSWYARLWDIVLSGFVPTIRGELLREYYLKQLAKYPAEEVTAAGMSPLFSRGVMVRPLVILSFLVITIVGFYANSLNSRSAFAAIVAVVCMIITMVLSVVFVADRLRHRRRPVSEGGIVISPHGLALRNKTLKGEMKWKELKKTTLYPSAKRPNMLRLDLPGIQISLADEYELPLWYLHEKILVAMQSRDEELMDGTIFVNSVAPSAVNDDPNPYRPPGA